MPVRRGFLGDAARRSSGNRDHVNQRLVISLRIVADGKLGCVGRNAVIVVAAVCKSSVDGHGLIAADSEALDVAVAIEEKCFTVARPVGGLEASGREIGNTS